MHMKIGAAFPDHIRTEKSSKRYGDPEQPLQIRSYFLILLLVITFGTILLKLFSVQIVYGSYYRSLSDTNRTRTNILHAERGIIFDRNKIPLVYNIPAFELKNGKEKINLSKEKAIELIAKKQAHLDFDPLRYYPYRDSVAHILGYIGKISKEDLTSSVYNNITPDDSIGKSGIEDQYDLLLRGLNGKELIEVDAMGRKLRTLGEFDPVPGQDITLTLDIRLQEAAAAAFPEGEKGSIIVSKPNGEILAMVSKPSFDPNLFTLGKNYEASNSAYTNVTDILSDNDNQPLMNRSISGVYPPGSTYKLITAAAGLENKIIDEHYQVEDTGVLKIGEFSFANWFYTDYGKTDGNVDVVKAISRSNDIFFYKLAEKISVNTLSKSAEMFGVGKKTGLDLPSEEKGILPTKEWKLKTMKEPWYLGDTYHYGIGQGYLLTTPIQVNEWTSVIANNGYMPKMHLLKYEIGKGSSQRVISDKTLELIRKGMVGACIPGGVAWPLFNFKVQNAKLKIDGKNFLEVKSASGSAPLKDVREISVACKTGTAQHGGEETKPHAWITLFAPAYNPEIIVTVLVESGGQGSNVAAPVAKKVLEAYFKN